MCNGKCVLGVGAADVVDYEAVGSQNAAVQFGNEAVRRAEGQVTFAAKVTLPFGQRSGYLSPDGQATVSEIDEESGDFRHFSVGVNAHGVSRIANRAFYLSAEAGGWRTTFLRFSPKGQGGRSRFAACSGLPVRTTSRRSTLRRCARRATLHRLAWRIRIRLGRSTRSRRRGGGRLRMGRLLHHSPLHQRGQTRCSPPPNGRGRLRWLCQLSEMLLILRQVTYTNNLHR